jgi:hypothetical protein
MSILPPAHAGLFQATGRKASYLRSHIGDSIAERILEALRAPGVEWVSKAKISSIFGGHVDAQQLNAAYQSQFHFGRQRAERLDLIGGFVSSGYSHQPYECPIYRIRGGNVERRPGHRAWSEERTKSVLAIMDFHIVGALRYYSQRYNEVKGRDTCLTHDERPPEW